MPPNRSILELAATISNHVSKLHETLVAQDIPSPSFLEDAKPRFPKEAWDARDEVLDAAAELYDLLLEPLTLLYKNHGASTSLYFDHSYPNIS